MGCINRIYRDLAGSPIPTLVRQKTLVRAARFFAPSHQLWVIISMDNYRSYVTARWCPPSDKLGYNPINYRYFTPESTQTFGKVCALTYAPCGWVDTDAHSISIVPPS